jgi:hypothetical protein
MISNTTVKKRGAQPGNTNALQHGFYSRQMHSGEIADLSAITPDLNGEIAMLRVLANCAVEVVTNADKYLPRRLVCFAELQGCRFT